MNAPAAPNDRAFDGCHARGGRSQFRIRFTTNTNTDGAIDFVAFYSGDFATATSRPRLTITYDYP